MARQWLGPDGFGVDETGRRQWTGPGGFGVQEAATNTYNETLTLSAIQALAASGKTVFPASISLQAVGVIGAAAAATFVGTISLGANATLTVAGALNIAVGLSFEAQFDQAASAHLDAHAAIDLAVHAAVEIGTFTENPIIGRTDLSGSITRTIELAGSSGQGAALSGSFMITIRLDGRLN